MKGKAAPAASSHLFMLHFLYCKRFKSQSPGHLPSPSAGVLTNFWRFWVPPSQSLEPAEAPKVRQDAS